MRYLDGIQEILDTIEEDEWPKIEKAASMVSEALTNGYRAFNACMNHIPPMANAYGTNGNPGVFSPIEYLLGEISFQTFHPGSFKGDVALFSDQYSSSPPLEGLAFQVKQSGASTIFIGPADSVKIIPSVEPNKTLSEICDLTIDTHSPMGDALLQFEGLEVPALPTSGITSVALFYVLSLEVAERLSHALLRRDHSTTERQTASLTKA